MPPRVNHADDLCARRKFDFFGKPPSPLRQQRLQTVVLTRSVRTTVVQPLLHEQRWHGSAHPGGARSVERRDRRLPATSQEAPMKNAGRWVDAHRPAFVELAG